MANTDISAAAAIAACNGIVDLIDGGTPPGLLRIYDGSKPADPDVAVGAQVLLAELTLSNPAFGGAVDASPGGRATASTITDDSSANATGTAAWFRVVQGGGNTGVIDGDVSATGGGGDLQLNSTAIQSGAQVSITSWTFTVPQGA
jgi:hypothetical protein